MNFAPKSEKEINEENLIPAGTYPFETMEAEAKKSKAGNDMIELTQRVFLPDGRERSVKDWLLASPAYKLFHYCSYSGLATQYEQGTLTSADCIGRTGYLKVIIQADKLGQYPDRNSVRDYVRPDMKPAALSTKKPEPTADQLANRVSTELAEDVPF